MPVHHELTFFALVAVVALICGMVLTRLKQPAIVGYIIAGVVLGPTGLALVEDRAQVNVFAELGVLLLVFLIGMELSLRAFKTVLRVALLGALMQIGVGLGVMLLLSQVLGWSIELAVLLGFVVALSSTAVAIKMLEDI
ncbi:MAG: cation:proton antiporter, partial [Alphaproteobacteria bacterium]